MRATRGRVRSLKETGLGRASRDEAHLRRTRAVLHLHPSHAKSPPPAPARVPEVITSRITTGYPSLTGAEDPLCDRASPLASHDSHLAGLAGRYATAAFELALEERALDALSADLESLKTLLTTSPDLARLVRSPIISREEQAQAMEAVLAAGKAAPLTRKLVLLLAQKRRLFSLADVIRAFETLLARHRGEVAADVTSARALTAEETAELRRVLKEKLGREPRLTTHVDPKLLGGLVLKLGSRMIDSSLRTKLDALRTAMKGA